MQEKENKQGPLMDNAITYHFIFTLEKIFKKKTDLHPMQMAETADKALITFLNEYEIYHFKDFWEKESTNHSEKMQRVILQYFLIHATQNYEMRRLMFCYDEIKKCLKGGDMHPGFVTLIRKHFVNLPTDLNVFVLCTWIECRKYILSKYILIKKYVFHKNFIFAIPDTDARKDIQKIYSRYMNTNSAQKFNLETKDEQPLLGFYSFFFGVTKLMYDRFLEKVDENGNKITQEQFVMAMAAIFDVNITYYYQTISSLKGTQKWDTLISSIDHYVK
jgi:hypothetical protein